MEQTCVRCGIIWEVNSTRKNQDTCKSCKTRKQQKVGDCLPWHGAFAEDLVTPVDEDGLEVLPGLRTCRNSDCVNGSHIVGAPK
jgi:hypothetical protein